MKKLITIFCVIASLNSFTSFDNIYAAQASFNYEETPSIFIDHEWTGDEDYLYLNLDLNPSLIFPDKYTTTSFKDGLGCQLKIDLSKNCALEYKGHKVSSYELNIELSNGSDNKSVFCDMKHMIQTTTVEGDQVTTNTYSIVKSTRIKNPSLDLSTRPEFITAEDNDNYGRIIFKNAFPYSKM
jgi:hypothetical protein